MRTRSVGLSLSAVVIPLSMLLCAPAGADVLVSNFESRSIEWFTNAGTWIDTFASTGPYVPESLAADPKNGDVVVATNTGTLLRFNDKGAPVAGCVLPASDGGNVTDSVLFDAAGDLYVATNYGTGGYTAVIHKYKHPIAYGNCVPTETIATGLERGDPLAFDAAGDICVASFADLDVRCFNSAGSQVYDYQSEIQPNGMEPAGVAFDASNRLIVSSAFSGTVLAETAARSAPLKVLSQTLTPTLYQLTLVGTKLYVPSFYNANARYGSGSCSNYACQDYDFNPDLIYRLDLSTTPATVTKFITTHVYGPTQMIFATVKKHHP